MAEDIDYSNLTPGDVAEFRGCQMEFIEVEFKPDGPENFKRVYRFKFLCDHDEERRSDWHGSSGTYLLTVRERVTDYNWLRFDKGAGWPQWGVRPHSDQYSAGYKVLQDGEKSFQVFYPGAPEEGEQANSRETVEKILSAHINS